MKRILLTIAALSTLAATANAQVLSVWKDGKNLYSANISEVDSVSFHEHEAVDLGLSVKWASYNLGATAPEEYGNYYAWGETEPKDTYSWSTYTYCKGDYKTLTKYCDNSSYGFTDALTTLEATDDAATQAWGGSWRMPTIDEWKELYNHTTQEWTDNYNDTGVAGYILTSTVSGYGDAVLFLPAAGYRGVSYLGDAGAIGYYWSSSLYEGYPYGARGVNFHASYFDTGYYRNRSGGLSVRAVCPAAE